MIRDINICFVYSWDNMESALIVNEKFKRMYFRRIGKTPVQKYTVKLNNCDTGICQWNM